MLTNFYGNGTNTRPTRTPRKATLLAIAPRPNRGGFGHCLWAVPPVPYHQEKAEIEQMAQLENKDARWMPSRGQKITLNSGVANPSRQRRFGGKVYRLGAVLPTSAIAKKWAQMLRRRYAAAGFGLSQRIVPAPKGFAVYVLQKTKK